MTYLQTLRKLGFDRSRHVPFTKQYVAACSHCEALAIQGTPCHETGCPQAVHECRGCDTLISRGTWCEACYREMFE